MVLISLIVIFTLVILCGEFVRGRPFYPIESARFACLTLLIWNGGIGSLRSILVRITELLFNCMGYNFIGIEMKE
jgi:hypothetical protein